MIVSHILNEQFLQAEAQEPSLLISNKNRGFCWLGNGISTSRYQGVYFCEDGKMFRVIEDIEQDGEVVEIRNKPWCAERLGRVNNERFFMPDFMNSFVYESGKKSFIFLDFKEAYSDDYAEYSVENQNGKIVVEIFYRGEKYFLVLRHSGNFTTENRWFNRDYSYDSKRNSSPSQRTVFFLGSFESGMISFGFSKDLDVATINAVDMEKSLELENKKKTRVRDIQRIISNDKVNLAYNSCRFLIDNLCDENGIIAGLPWFFQYWSRDELICLGGVNSVRRESAKKIVLKWISELTGKMVLPAKFKEDLSPEGESLDAFGWLLKRLEDFPEIVESKKEILMNFFNSLDAELVDIDSYSWMDSIKREKAVEIQAMKLFALNFAFRISGDKKFQSMEWDLKQKVKELYFKEGVLLDSSNGGIRPNVFIAYYFYSALLTHEEWESAFDNEIKYLWSGWGGFSSIAKDSPEFHSKYSGEDGKSYHNGDSWFWINNLAGKVLTEFDRERYYEEIKSILNASTNEILFSGAIGSHSELSSFEELRSEGAVCQAFSAAMYIEFVEKLIG